MTAQVHGNLTGNLGYSVLLVGQPDLRRAQTRLVEQTEAVLEAQVPPDNATMKKQDLIAVERDTELLNLLRNPNYDTPAYQIH